MKSIEKNLMDQVMKQFQSIVQQSGVKIDPDYEKSIEDTFGVSVDQIMEMEKQAINSFKMKELRVKKIHPDAVLPKYAHETDSAFDLHSVEDIEIPPFGRVLIPTGLKFEFDNYLELQIRPKSGLAINQGITVLNTPGTVDCGYTGEIKVIIFNTNNEPFKINKGMKVAQAALCPIMNGKYVSVKEVDEFQPSQRGENGFGSTGL